MKPLERLGLAALAAVCSMSCQAEDSPLDVLHQSLSYQTSDGFFRTRLGGLADFEGYTIDRHPPGLVFGSGDYLISPRMSLFLDTQLGSHLYSLVQVRFDRGFDPGSVPRGDVRFELET